MKKHIAIILILAIMIGIVPLSSSTVFGTTDAQNDCLAATEDDSTAIEALKVSISAAEALDKQSFDHAQWLDIFSVLSFAKDYDPIDKAFDDIQSVRDALVEIIEGKPLIKGDADRNGEVDQFDYLLLKRSYFDTYKLYTGDMLRSDVNDDGVADQFDYLCIKRAYFGTYMLSDPWEKAIDYAVYTVKAKQSAADGNSVGFVFTSDMHVHAADANSIPYVKNIGKVAKEVMNRCNLTYFVTTGDMTAQAAITNAVATSKQSLYDDMAEFWNILSPIRQEQVISCMGNHDALYGYNDNKPWAYSLSKEETYELLFAPQATDKNRTFAEDGSYFYVDIPEDRFRFIVLNSQWSEYTIDENGTPSHDRFSESFYGQAQIDWLANTALDMPSGYTAAVFLHCVPVGENSDSRYGKDYSLVAGILKAFYYKIPFSGSFTGKEDWQSSSISVDYTYSTGVVCAVFGGHNHIDVIRNNGLTGCPIIQITAAKNYDYGTDAPTRTPDTSTETAMDIVTIDTKNHKIHLTRLGVGEDREVSYYAFERTPTD